MVAVMLKDGEIYMEMLFKDEFTYAIVLYELLLLIVAVMLKDGEIYMIFFC
jgi:hypothetical protein